MFYSTGFARSAFWLFTHYVHVTWFATVYGWLHGYTARGCTFAFYAGYGCVYRSHCRLVCRFAVYVCTRGWFTFCVCCRAHTVGCGYICCRTPTTTCRLHTPACVTRLHMHTRCTRGWTHVATLPHRTPPRARRICYGYVRSACGCTHHRSVWLLQLRWLRSLILVGSPFAVTYTFGSAHYAPRLRFVLPHARTPLPTLPAFAVYTGWFCTVTVHPRYALLFLGSPGFCLPQFGSRLPWFCVHAVYRGSALRFWLVPAHGYLVTYAVTFTLRLHAPFGSTRLDCGCRLYFTLRLRLPHVRYIPLRIYAATLRSYRGYTHGCSSTRLPFTFTAFPIRLQFSSVVTFTPHRHLVRGYGSTAHVHCDFHLLPHHRYYTPVAFPLRTLRTGSFSGLRLRCLCVTLPAFTFTRGLRGCVLHAHGFTQLYQFPFASWVILFSYYGLTIQFQFSSVTVTCGLPLRSAVYTTHTLRCHVHTADLPSLPFFFFFLLVYTRSWFTLPLRTFTLHWLHGYYVYRLRTHLCATTVYLRLPLRLRLVWLLRCYTVHARTAHAVPLVLHCSSTAPLVLPYTLRFTLFY